MEKLVKCVPAALKHTHGFHLISTPHRAFEGVYNCLSKLGQRPFLKRYLRRGETLSSISTCDTALNDAREMFSVSVMFHLTGHPSRPTVTRPSAVAALYPDPYTEACRQSHRTATRGNA